MATKIQDEIKAEASPVRHDNSYGFLTPRSDIYEGPEGYTVFVEMPGAARSSLKVELEKGHLVIEGKMDRSPVSGQLIREEIFKRNYRRAFRLSNEVDPNGIQAKWHDGILEVTLDKKPASKHQEITINYN